jgi:uncharacterized protein (DUF1015 family)
MTRTTANVLEMLRISAFQGLYAAPAYGHLVACVPYDVVTREQAAKLAAGNPYSLLHVDRAEIDLPENTDPYSPRVYEKAAENFQALQRERILVREDGPCLYVYQQVMGPHSQIGVAALCHIDDYESVIKTHEKTRKDKEADRTRLIETLSAHTGPVFLTYRDNNFINHQVARIQEQKPLHDFTAPDGIRHTVWRVNDTQDLVARFNQIPAAYVADGHHRTASAVTVGRQRRAQSQDASGDASYNWFLCVLFPGSQLQILPYNRCIQDLGGLSAEEFLRTVEERFHVRTNASPAPDAPGRISMYLGRRWYGLNWDRDKKQDPELDVTVLQDRLLAPVLGIGDPRTNDRIEFIGGIRGTDELERRVNSGEAAVAFSMYPTTVDQLMAIADAGEIMPPKSTWFEPKLRSGLFVYTF